MPSAIGSASAFGRECDSSNKSLQRAKQPSLRSRSAELRRRWPPPDPRGCLLARVVGSEDGFAFPAHEYERMAHVFRSRTIWLPWLVVAFASNLPGSTNADVRCNPSALARTFSLEEREPTWAEAAESILLSRIAQAPALQLTNLMVECHETICHLRFVFPTEKYQQVSGNTLVADAVDGTPGFHIDFGQIILRADEASSVDYYLLRTGVCPQREVR